MSKPNSSLALQLARRHVGNGAAMESSARVALAAAVLLHDDAMRAEMADDYDALVEASILRARKSLAYSVGVFHDDWRAVNQMVAAR